MAEFDKEAFDAAVDKRVAAGIKNFKEDEENDAKKKDEEKEKSYKDYLSNKKRFAEEDDDDDDDDDDKEMDDDDDDMDYDKKKKKKDDDKNNSEKDDEKKPQLPLKDFKEGETKDFTDDKGVKFQLRKKNGKLQAKILKDPQGGSGMNRNDGAKDPMNMGVKFSEVSKDISFDKREEAMKTFAEYTKEEDDAAKEFAQDIEKMRDKEGEPLTEDAKLRKRFQSHIRYTQAKS